MNGGYSVIPFFFLNMKKLFSSILSVSVCGHMYVNANTLRFLSMHSSAKLSPSFLLLTFKTIINWGSLVYRDHQDSQANKVAHVCRIFFYSGFLLMLI